MKSITKIFFLIVMAVIICQCEKKSEVKLVYIPDNNFLNALIDLGVDKDGDGAINTEEAIAVKKLLLREKQIADLKGIEAFVNLDTLDCYYNNLSNLDISKNTRLLALICDRNNLAELELTGNPSLKFLYCAGNELSSLDLSNNTALEILFCEANQIGTLDLSHCSLMSYLRCYNCKLTDLNLRSCTFLETLFAHNNPSSGNANQLTSLDLSNNTGLKFIYLSNLPSLYEVCVWEVPLPDDVHVNIEASPNIFFTTECN
ncbi:MAG: hypothetical protein E4G95_08240 [Bacteroidia bacterium]|nr:MAG: hypothetical protein E4G95_08240 [Bacteroidia bacterium]